MKEQYKNQSTLIQNLVKALKALREGGVTSTKKDFTCQIGEWLVKEIYSGKFPTSPNNKDWDVISNDNRIQVKTHAKAATNKNRHTKIHYDDKALIDELVIVVFSPDYILLAFYQIPWIDALPLISHNSGGSIISWSKLTNYKLAIKDLPNQSVVNLFKGYT